MQSTRAKVLIALAGAILGVLIVRGFFLDPVEELGWRMFWEGAARGQTMNLETVLRSSTFAKSLVGFVLGGVSGLGVSALMKKKQDQPK